MNSSKHTECQDLVHQLKKDARQWNGSPPNEEHKKRTLQAIRREFSSNQPTRQIISFPSLSPSWVAAAALMVLSAGFLVYQLNQPEPQEVQITRSHQELQRDLEVLTTLPQIPNQLVVSASLLEDPFLNELNAIVEEMEATIQGLLELVEAS